MNVLQTATKKRLKESLRFYAYISPWLIGFLVFTLYPILHSALLSFMQWDLVNTMKWVGLANYRRAFLEDPLFVQSIKVTTLYTVFSVPLGIIFALFLAVLLNTKVRGMSLFRTIFYLPNIISGVAASVIWVWIFNPQVGILNAFLGLFGIDGPGWIFDPNWVIPSMVIMSLWSVGGNMLILLAGLQGIPVALYEAAQLDGANKWRQIISITIPTLSPVLFFTLVMSIIGTFQTFTQAFVMTSGGPNNASLFYVLHLYNNAFEFFRMGYASALAWILFIIILSLTLLVFTLQKRWVYYESSN